MPDTRWRRLAYAAAPWDAQAICLAAISAGVGSFRDRYASQAISGGSLHVASLAAEIEPAGAGGNASIDAPDVVTNGSFFPTLPVENPLFTLIRDSAPPGTLRREAWTSRPMLAVLAAPLIPGARAIRWRIPESFAGLNICWLTLARAPSDLAIFLPETTYEEITTVAHPVAG